MKKVALFPFGVNLLPIVKYFDEMQDEYQLTEVIALPGMGLAGRDVADVCNQPPIEIKVIDKLCFDNSQWKYLILVMEYLPSDYDTKRVIQTALSYGKEIIVMEHSSYSMQEWTANMCASEDAVHLLSLESFLPDDFIYRYYSRIKTPVLLVGGIVEQADVFETVVAVTKSLKEMGLSVAAITNEAAGGIFGFFDIKDLYFGMRDISENISQINQKLQAIELKYTPDIIVIQAPDAVIRYNNIVPNGFGIYTYALCQAVQPDYFVCCMPYDLINREFVNLLNEDFKQCLGVGIDMIHASNLLIDSLDLINSRSMSTFYMNYQNMCEAIIGKTYDMNIPVLNVSMQKENMGDLLKKIISDEGDYDDK